MKVILTGGRGFAGRYLHNELVLAGHEVIAPSSREMDVRDRVAVERTLAAIRPGAVVHLAAIAHPGDAAADPDAAFSVAIEGTANVVEAIRAHAPDARLLAVSSAGVYGSGQAVPVLEDAPVRPDSTYGMAKLAMESIALASAARYHLSAIVVRPFNYSGPGQTAKFVLPAFAERVVDATLTDGETIRVGNLQVRRDFLHVRDVVRAYRLLLELSDGRADGRVVNVASGHSVSLEQVLQSFVELAGARAAVVRDEALVRSAEVVDSCGDPSLLMELTGWRPEVGLDRLIADVMGDAIARSLHAGDREGRPRP